MACRMLMRWSLQWGPLAGAGCAAGVRGPYKRRRGGPTGGAPRQVLGRPASRSLGSALAVLRRAAGLLEAVLLALDDASVAREVPLLLEHGAEVRVDLQQRAGDAELDGVGLAAGATALDGDDGVVAAGGVGVLEGLERLHAHQDATEVLLELTAVDGDAAAAGAEEDAGDGFLAPSGAIELFHQANSIFLGCCASCGCAGPAYTLRRRMRRRPMRVLGSMPHTACSSTRSGCFASISRAVVSLRPPW